jgi:hypothetical protein
MNLNVPIAQQVPQIQEGISNSIGAVTNTIGSAATAISDVRGTVNSSVQDFASKDLVGSSNEFLQANTLVAKFVFMVFVLIIFLILMNLGIYLLSYFLQPDTSPYLIKGIQSGSSAKKFPQDPSQDDAATIYRSNNQTTGMEYTWSFWIKVKEPVPSARAYNHVFSKGLTNAISTDSGQVVAGSNAPGVYLKNDTVSGNTTTTMAIVMDTVNGDDSETIEIPNIPFRKWVHIAIRLQNKILDVYINGTLKQRVSFKNVPKQNYGDVFASQNGGFDGQLSNLRYFDRALNAFQISNISMSGPNLKPVPDVVDTSSDYLSGKWY